MRLCTRKKGLKFESHLLLLLAPDLRIFKSMLQHCDIQRFPQFDSCVSKNLQNLHENFIIDITLGKDVSTESRNDRNRNRKHNLGFQKIFTCFLVVLLSGSCEMFVCARLWETDDHDVNSEEGFNVLCLQQRQIGYAGYKYWIDKTELSFVVVCIVRFAPLPVPSKFFCV